MGITRIVPAGGDWLIEGLAAEGPFPECADKLSLFGQFVGDWDIVEEPRDRRYLDYRERRAPLAMDTRGKGGAGCVVAD